MRTLRFTIWLLVLACGACTTTKDSRQSAQQLQALVKQYRLAQEQQIDQINKQYQETFQKLIREEQKIENLTTLQQFDLDALQISDQLIWNWEQATQPRQFRDVFAASLQQQLARMADAESVIATARQNYANAYQNITVNLSRLKEVEAGLQTLATSPSNTKETLDLLKKLYAAYQKVNSTGAPGKSSK